MSTTTENLRHDVHKAPAQLEREADSARSAVEGTLAALEQKLSPGEMLDRVMDMAKRHGGEFGENLLTQVRNNPMPTIIAGVGVAWLMAASKKQPRRGAWSEERMYADGDDVSTEGIGAAERWSSVAEPAKHAAADAFEATTDAAHRAAAAATRVAHGTADATRHAAERVADVSRSSMRGMTNGYEYLCREQPFVLGAIAIAAGAALGSLLRPTTMENSVLGEASDAARSRLKSEAQARTEDLRNAATSALDTAKQEIAASADNRGVSNGNATRDGGSGIAEQEEPTQPRPV